MSSFCRLRALLSLGFTALSAHGDLKNRKISNKIIFPAMAAGVLINILDAPRVDIRPLIYFVFFMIILIAAFARGAAGGGDIKLLFCLALYYPNEMILNIFTVSVICAAAAALVLIVTGLTVKPGNSVFSGKRIKGASGDSERMSAADRKTGLPLAPFILLGMIVNMIFGGNR